ncbi:valine--tRNA ligase, mitochondrial [Pundamilia nyererei]|uniref:Valine--tRNA ligase n=1 Tax=Pundamilia nyererei TaxID=303518 RepID=A0A9Y6MC42_9CICH|nr:PREDICTED: valine--tRNA ligase, mitochondrial-like [Pundamilia nyererei]
MWRTGPGPSLRRAARLCSSTPPKASHTNFTARPHAEKQRRRRVREEGILSSQHGSAEGKAVKWSEKQKIAYTAPTPPGAKKDTSLPFPSCYSPEYVESSWYQWWEKEGFFSPEQHERLPHAVDQTFSLCIPPPNVTGTLHLGHALTVAVEDALVRWRRMQGCRVLWVPGCDHAGIATQTVVERRLLRQTGKHRRDFTRDEFLEEVWKWKNEKGDEIYHQLRKLGASLDWSRPCFTMDPGFSRAVTAAFVRLCDSGLIYRSEGLVSWSCALESAISDIEVDSKELSGRTMLSVPGYEHKVEFGSMLSFAYPVEGHDTEVVVSTTRPETMLGDVAIAVHPDDPRYQTVHGKHCRHPFTDRLLPIITDSMVDVELGTGAVKVTPAHDHTDFVLSQRHSLPRLTVIAGDGTMTESCGQWLEGVKRFDARQLVVDALVEKRLFRGRKAHAMSLPVCRYSSACTLNEQWVWGRSEDEARQRAAVKYGLKPDAVTLTRDPDVLDTWFSSALFPFAMLGWPDQTADLQQFYPNSVLETGSDLIFFWVARMVMLGTELTGQLPFKQVLFHSLVRDKYGRKMSKSLGNVIDPLDVIHGVSLERLQGKVKEGNLDPREQLVAMEAQRKDFPAGIPECGTDALRFALCSHKMQGEDLSLSVAQVLSCRHFCNKMWQTLRFTLGVLSENGATLETIAKTAPLSSMDRWICSRLHSTVGQCEQAFEAYELHSVTSALYSFWVHSLCDIYMEYIKPLLTQQDQEVVLTTDAEHSGDARQAAIAVLYHCVSVSLALLSPFMPFITEELWQRLQPFAPEAAAQTSLCLQPYPRSAQLAHWHFAEEERDFLLVQEVIRVARSLRAQCGITKAKPDMWAVCSPSQAEVLLRFGSAIRTLSRISDLHICCSDRGSIPPSVHSTSPPKTSLAGVVDHTCQLHLHVQSGMNIEKQIVQLSQRRDRLVPKLDQILARVQSPSYLTKVPSHVREQMDSKVSALEQELKTVEDQLKLLQEMQTAE